MFWVKICVVIEGSATVGNPAGQAITPDQAQLKRAGLVVVRGEDLALVQSPELLVFGMDAAGQQSRVVVKLVGSIADDLATCRTAVTTSADRIDPELPIERVLEYLPHHRRMIRIITERQSQLVDLPTQGANLGLDKLSG